MDVKKKEREKKNWKGMDVLCRQKLFKQSPDKVKTLPDST